MKLDIDYVEFRGEANSYNEFVSLWQNISTQLNSDNRFIKHVLIDGQSEYGSFETYVMEQFATIQSIRIETMSELELVESTIAEIFSYNKKMIAACDSIGSLFYGEMNEENWRSFQSLLEGLQWLLQSLTGAANIMQPTQEELAKKFQHISGEIERIIFDLDKALQQEELVEAGDAIRYELYDVLIELDKTSEAGV